MGPNPSITFSTGPGLTDLQTAKIGALTVPIAYDDDRPLTAADLPSSIGSDVKLALNVDDGVITDASTGARTATLGADAHVSTDRGFVGLSSIEFDGTGDYITFPQSTDDDFAAGDFMVEAAVYPTMAFPVSGDTHIISKWALAGARAWSLYFYNDAGTQRIAWSHTTDGTTQVETVFSNYTVPANNTWYHIRVSRVSNVLYLFIDGKLEDSTAYSPTIATVTRVLEIGSIDSGTGIWTGYIDSVRTQKGGTVSTDEFDVLRVPFSGATVAYQPEADVKSFTVSPVTPTTDVTTSASDAVFSYEIPSELNGYCVSAVAARHDTAGSGGTASNIKIKKDGTDILSTDLTIDSTETNSSTAATAAVLDRTQNDLATGDILTFLLTAADTTTVPKGLSISLTLKN